MNYRTRPAENVYSLEELFIKYLGLDIPIVPQTSSYSNKHTFSQLFFTRNPNQSDDIDVILSYSVFKESSIDELKKVASSPNCLFTISSTQMRVILLGKSLDRFFLILLLRITMEACSRFLYVNF